MAGHALSGAHLEVTERERAIMMTRPHCRRTHSDTVWTRSCTGHRSTSPAPSTPTKRLLPRRLPSSATRQTATSVPHQTGVAPMTRHLCRACRSGSTVAQHTHDTTMLSQCRPFHSAYSACPCSRVSPQYALLLVKNQDGVHTSNAQLPVRGCARCRPSGCCLCPCDAARRMREIRSTTRVPGGCGQAVCVALHPKTARRVGHTHGRTQLDTVVRTEPCRNRALHCSDSYDRRPACLPVGGREHGRTTGVTQSHPTLYG